MDTLIQANIFFFITSIAVILGTACLAVSFYYIISILRDIRQISRRAEEGSKIFAEELKEVWVEIKEEGTRIKGLTKIFAEYVHWFATRRNRATKQHKRA